MPLDLFKDRNASMRLLPISLAIETQWKSDSGQVNLPSQAQLREVSSYLDVNPDHLYVRDSGFVPFFYWHDHVWYSLVSLQMEHLELLRVKESINGMRNEIRQCIETGDFKSAFLHIDKRVSFESYAELFDVIPDAMKYELFRDVYTDSEYGFDELRPQALEAIFGYRKLSKKDDVVRKKLKRFMGADGYVTIYRGIGELSAPVTSGYSWTTDMDIARFFANRLNKGSVYRGKVDINDVVDYISDRGEYEVLVMPCDVEEIERMSDGELS